MTLIRLSIFIFISLLSYKIMLASDNDYSLYSKALSEVKYSYSESTRNDSCDYFYISEEFIFDSIAAKDIQKYHYKKIQNFSVELANKFRNLTIHKHTIKDSLTFETSCEFLKREEFNKYFNKNTSYGWPDFYKNHKIGAIVELSKILYNNSKTKAVLMICIYSGCSSGRIYLVQMKKKNNEWALKKINIIGYID